MQPSRSLRSWCSGSSRPASPRSPLEPAPTVVRRSDGRHRRPSPALPPEEPMKLLVMDVGTSGMRAAVVEPGRGVTVSHRRELLPDSPAPGLVEFDARAMADAALELANRAIDDADGVD